MKQLYRYLPLMFVCHAFSVHASDEVCAREDSKILGKSIKYCWQRSRPDLPPQPGEAVVYFMPGMTGGNWNWTFFKYDSQVVESWKGGQHRPITFVSFRNSIAGFYTDKAGVPTGPKAYETWFVDEFLPYIEKTLHVCATQACRGIHGLSMGAYGALKTVLRHPDLFALASANSPALAPFSVQEPREKWKEYWKHTPMGSLFGMFMLKELLKIFPTEEFWEENDPATLVSEHRPGEAAPALYFDMGTADEFGFEAGYARLTDALDRSGMPYTGVLEQGAGHIPSAARRRNSIEFVRDFFDARP